MPSSDVALAELQALIEQTVRALPLLAAGLALLVATWFATKWTARLASTLLRHRLRSPLLRDVTARAVAVPVFLLGLYVVLRVSGLARLAVSVLGGAGLLGLIVGFAFRDIAENFLASILLGMQHPFARGDLIEVAGYEGFVQSVNTRSTLLMTLDGNHVQIPNASVYKGIITNFTANPYARFDFAVGIGYDDEITEAQATALQVLRDHPAVVNDPEPLVLVDSLGASTVNLKVYYWVDIGRYSPFKVQSAVIRLTKGALDRAGISMPDEAREVVFPHGIPVSVRREGASVPDETGRPLEDTHAGTPRTRGRTTRGRGPRTEAEPSEGDLGSEAHDIARQARRARPPETGPDLLDDEPAADGSG
jgi:small-conductance mechanosensitive channel